MRITSLQGSDRRSDVGDATGASRPAWPASPAPPTLPVWSRPEAPPSAVDRPELFRYFTETLGWIWSVAQSRLVWDFLLDAAAHCRGATVLDAGAGHQRYRPFFEPECLYLAQEHPAGIAAKQMQGVTYDLVAEIDRFIPLSDSSVRGVINTSVLEHVRHPEGFFREAFRILEPGGRLYTHVPFTYPEHEEPFDFNRPTRYGLQTWLGDAGFDPVLVAPGSSSITAAVAHVEQALREDLLDRGRFDVHRDVSKRIGPALDLLRRVGEERIHADSRLPIGWLSVAVKPGELDPAPAAVPQRAPWLARHVVS